MKHLKNSRAASTAPQSSRQTPIAAVFVAAPRQEAPFRASPNPAPVLPAAPRTSPPCVVLRTPAVAIAKFLIDYLMNPNPQRDLTILSFNRYASRQVSGMEWGLGIFAVWLVFFLSYWIKHPDKSPSVETLDAV
jgi:hypothetical protein